MFFNSEEIIILYQLYLHCNSEVYMLQINAPVKMHLKKGPFRQMFNVFVK